MTVVDAIRLLPTTTISLGTDDVEQARQTVCYEPHGEHFGITPVVTRDEAGATVLTGRFSVTHLPSGHLAAGGHSGCIQCCRRLAKALSALDIDWSVADRQHFADLPPETHEQIRQVLSDDWCAAENCYFGDDAERLHALLTEAVTA